MKYTAELGRIQISQFKYFREYQLVLLIFYTEFDKVFKIQFMEFNIFALFFLFSKLFTSSLLLTNIVEYTLTRSFMGFSNTWKNNQEERK